MNKIIDLFYKIYQNPKALALTILAFFFSGIGVGLLADSYAGTQPKWIPQALQILNYVLVFGSFGWSLLHPFITYTEQKTTWKKYIFWIVVALIPIYYIITSIVLLYFDF